MDRPAHCGDVAQLFVAGHAVVALATAPTAEDRDGVSLAHGGDTTAEGRDDTGVLMTENQRHSRKDLNVAVDHVDIAVTEPCALDADEDLPGPRRGRRYVFDDELVSVIV